MEGSGKYYLISHLVLLTGLTDRTIRKYISSGILQGEKIDGLWHFTPEQVEGFVRHPAVRPSILAKHHAAVYDFLLDDQKNDDEICVVPEETEKKWRNSFVTASTTGIFTTSVFPLTERRTPQGSP